MQKGTTVSENGLKSTFAECNRKTGWNKLGELFINFSTFIEAICSRVSPLWFLFITAGLPEVGRITDAVGVQGDFWPTEGRAERLSPRSCLEFRILLSHLGLAEDGRLRMAGDICDFLLLPGEALGLFGVVSNVVTSSTLHLFEECFKGETLLCSSFELGPCVDSLLCCMTLSDMLWPGWVWSFSTVLSSEIFWLMVFLPGLRSFVLPCGTSGWGSSDVTAGLRKETLLLDLLALSAQGCSFSFIEFSSSVMPHCWFMASSLFFVNVSLVCFRVVLVAPCTDISLLAAFFLVNPFFLFLFSFLHLWEQEPESWDDEEKLKTDRSPR